MSAPELSTNIMTRRKGGAAADVLGESAGTGVLLLVVLATPAAEAVVLQAVIGHDDGT
jgi:hypothetical protein